MYSKPEMSLQMANVNTHLFDKMEEVYQYDLQHAFYQIKIRSDTAKHFSFCFDNKCYFYTCLPFGYSGACYIMERSIKMLLYFVGTQSQKIFISYLDDIIEQKLENDKK